PAGNASSSGTIGVGNRGSPTAAARAIKRKYGRGQMRTIGIPCRSASLGPNDKGSTTNTGISRGIKYQRISSPQIRAIQIPRVRILRTSTDRAISANVKRTAAPERYSVETTCDHPKEAGENKLAPDVNTNRIGLRCDA